MLQTQGVATGRVGPKQIGTVFQDPFQGVTPALDQQGQVVFRRRPIDFEHGDVETRKIDHRRWVFLVTEGDLEDGCVTWIPVWLHRLYELLEGQLLVGGHRNNRAGNVAHQFPEREIASQLAAHRKGVDEDSDHGLEFGPYPAGHRRTDGDVILVAQAMEQGGEGAQQDHVAGRANFARQQIQLRREWRLEVESNDAASARSDRRSVTIGWQIQGRRCSSQLILPVAALGLEFSRLQHLPLPRCVVGVLE